MIHRFGGFELDDALYELRRDGVVVPMQRRAFDLLSYLIRHRDAVVSKGELLENVWVGTSVAKDALPQAMMSVRNALGDDVDQPTFVHTVRGRGYRFVAPLDSSTAIVPVSSPRQTTSTLIGRSTSLELLRERFARAASGQGGLALITGPAGIGKTRLLEEIPPLVANNARVVLVRCHSDVGAPSLFAFAEALRRIEAWGARLSANVAALSTLDKSEIDTDAKRFRLFDDVASTFATCASSEQPLALVIDDLEHADPRSLELLSLLVTRARSIALLVVAAYRQASSHPTLARLSSEPSTTSITLEPFTKDEVALYLEQVLPKPPAPSVIEKVFAKTLGNPLFVSQLVHVLRAEERLRAEDIATSSIVGNDNMREAIIHHLASLPDNVVRTLTGASIFGRAFFLAPLAAALDLTNADLLRELDVASQARIINPTSNGLYRFSYPLVRDVLYKRLAASERARLHGRAADSLRAHLDEDKHASVAEVAGHLIEAAAGTGDIDAATDWSLRAIALAERAGDVAAATQYAQRGLDAFHFAQKPDIAKRARLLAVVQRAVT